MSGPPLVWLVVGTGWGARTFLQTPVLDRLCAVTRVGVLAASGLVSGLRRQLAGRARLAELSPFDPAAGRYGAAYRRRDHHFQRLSATATRGFKERQHRRTLHGRWREQLAHHALRLDAAVRASSRTLERLEAAGERAFVAEYSDRARYHELLAGARLVVATAPHVALEAPPILVARQRELATAAWITSWDNLTSKPAFFTRYDLYLLWSERMGDDLRRYYPESAAARRAVVGVPHFEWYRDPAMVGGREELCRSHGLDPTRPLILYAGATPHRAPGEELVVHRLAADFSARPLAERPQLLVRLHPGDAGGRYAAWEPPPGVVIEVPGSRGRGRLEGFCPTPEENRDLVAAVRHADVVVNLASTITLEAAMCDRPVVNVAYDLAAGAPHREQIETYYRDFDHYRTVVASGAVRIARSPEELVTMIDRYLADPALDRLQRQKLADLWCGPRDGRSPERIVDALLALIEPGEAA